MSEQWGGETILPSGFVCEAKCMVHGNELDWTPVIIKYMSKFTVVLCDMSDREYDSEFVAHPVSVYFRPLRTPEQIAAEKREEFATQLVQEMGKSPTGFPNAMNQARKIYDLGYRKVEGAKE